MLFEVCVLGCVHEAKGGDFLLERKAEPVARKEVKVEAKKESPAKPEPVISQAPAVEAAPKQEVGMNWSKFDFMTLVANIKNTTGKSFVSMSLKSSTYTIE